MRLLPREEKFFHYFIDQAQLIRQAAVEFREAAEKGPNALREAEVAIAVLEGKGDEVIHEIFTRLNQTFITPLDPEDIHALGSYLDDVLDGIEKTMPPIQFSEVSGQHRINVAALLTEFTSNHIEAARQQTDHLHRPFGQRAEQ